MKTITTVVKDTLSGNPLLTMMVQSPLVNLRAVAADLRPTVERELGYKVGTDSIAMALRRLQNPSAGNLASFFSAPSGVNINGTYHNLTAFNYQRGYTGADTIPSSVRYFVQTTGSSEHTIIISDEDAGLLGNEGRLRVINDLSAICLALPSNSADYESLYAGIFLTLAAADISVVEVVSTFNELTLIIKDTNFTSVYQLLA